jgi:phenylacetate-CoA ligase
MNIFNFVLLLKGFPIYEATKDIEKFKELNISYNPEPWHQFEYFKANNNFYYNFINSRLGPIENWKDIPILQKKDIQRPLKELLSSSYQLHKLFRNNTSGSSGTPFFFAKNMEAHALTWALANNRYAWHGIEHGKSLQARFYGIPLSGIKFYKEKVKDLIANRIRFPVFNLTDEKLEEFIEVFRKRKINYINGYTSSLVYFADYCVQRGVILKEVCPSLQVCFPTSEMVSKEDRIIMERGFGVKVVNEYGCAEIDIIAFEDLHGDWIISNENIYIEIVDDDGNILPEGQEGRILITSLTNKAMPFIRYELGDIGAISKRKRGNHQILEKLIGRTNEFAFLPSGRKVPALTFYYITKTLIKENSMVKEFIIKQVSLSHFVFEYVAKNEISKALEVSVEKALEEYLESGLTASFVKVDEVIRGKTGKLKQFYNLINKES